MRIPVCLLLSLAAGCATYTLGAIVWSGADPQGAGKVLLFTIPTSFALAAGAGVLGLIGLIFRCDWIREPKPRRQRATAAARATTPAPATPTAPAKRSPRPAPTRQREHAFDYDDTDFALAV